MPITEGPDVLINDNLGLMIARDPKKPSVIEETFRPPTGDPVSILYDSFDHGGAFSRRWLPRTYDRAVNLHMRTPTIVLPAGYVTAKPLPAAMAAAGIPITSSVVYLDGVYMFAGRYAAVSASGTGDFSIVKDFGTTFAALSATVFDNKMLVGGKNPITGESAGLYSFDGTTWTQSADAPKELLSSDTVYWTRKAQGSSRLIATRDQGNHPCFYQHISSGDNPLIEANWSAPIQVGRPEYPINSIALAPQHVYFCKGEGVFDVDARDYTPNLTPWFRSTYERLNGEHSVILNGPDSTALYVGHFQGLHRLILDDRRQTGSQPCGPGTGTPTETNIYGSPTALTVDGTGWVCAAYHDGVDASVWYGRDRDEMGVQVPGPLVWHGSECTLEGQKITHMRVVSVNGDPKLWMAAQDNGGGTIRVYAQSIPLGGSPYQDYLWPKPTSRVASGWHEFAESGELYLPAEDWGNVLALKVLRKLKISAPGASSSITQEIFAAIDGGAFVSQHMARESYFSGIPQAEAQIGRTIQLKITGTGARRTPFILRAVEAEADVIVEQSGLLEIPIIIALFQPYGTNVPSGREPDTLWGRLLAMVEEPVYSFRVRGIRQEFRAKVLPFPGRRIVQDAEGRPWYSMTTLRLSVMDPPMGYLIWDGQTPYDSGFGYES